MTAIPPRRTVNRYRSSLGLLRHQLLHALRLLAQPLRVLGGTVEYRRRLERLELAARRRHVQHMQMDPRVLVPRKTDVAEFARLPGLHERGVGPFVIEDPVRVFVPEHLVVLDEVDHLDPEATERLVELPRGFLL